MDTEDTHSIQVADGKTLISKGSINCDIEFMDSDGNRFKKIHKFHILQNLNFSVILGRDIKKGFKSFIELPDDSIYINASPARYNELMAEQEKVQEIIGFKSLNNILEVDSAGKIGLNEECWSSDQD